MNKFIKILNLGGSFFWVIIIIIFSFYLMWQAVLTDSAITDELAHIPAGYSYVAFQDYRLNPEHPPLVKIIAGLPLLLLDLNFPNDKPFWTDDINGQWTSGYEFIFNSDNNADQILKYSRFGPTILSLILLLILYIWSSKLIGRWWALLPLTLLALSPIFLAHGHYVTTDIGATLGVMIALFSFSNFLNRPNRKNLVIAGLCFGIAQLLKFSAILLGPLFILLALVHYANNAYYKLNAHTINKTSYLLKSATTYIFSLLSIFFIAGILIYLVYLPITFNQPTEKLTSDATHILSGFKIKPLADLTITLSQNDITKPLAEYMLGVLMVITRASGGNDAYFLGQVSNTGSPLYFPLAYLLKEPLPIFMLIITSFILALLNIKRVWQKRGIKINEYLSTHFAEFSMLSFIILYWYTSVTSPLNIGVRHILPTMPLIYILTASSLKRWVTIPFKNIKPSLNFIQNFYKITQIIFRGSLKLFLIALAILWLLIETLAVSPYFLSSYNELGGGTKNGYKLITDSNYDWGQDLKRLENFVEANQIDKIALDYFGGDSPEYRLGDKYVKWWSAKNNPAEENIEWLAVSVNTLQNSTGDLKPSFIRKDEDSYLWLKTARNLPLSYSEAPKPDYIVGTSIFVYHLE
ncbi:MAG: hypothetical protein COV57_02125 [Candidatus Liptonbacteria bacterium CG11_big_fil_rev_8_21_14_0_20_35_14]|uniref:Glycosyltransferase RgtA/B/C/D-like domain-containing protein n=1 Tax=Candidatus Liptonbacteria bacterium CG11_big_fil_rev_8_21_14_0_20_35_14 TaxID=1974634 RepID=A0A2H0N7K3_9BACT|nr:MAG: hypothetical protein COV57_02125 [Candidatus Liptonbacteria bacterium CG11_big_fil_rev_8_21_14_0_20_35_14]